MKRTASKMSPGSPNSRYDVETNRYCDPDVVETTDVLVVGAGPAGLMLATQLARFGVSVKILDDRPDKTSTGRADGLQPKTIETLKQMRLAEPVLRKGVKIYDICYWNSEPGKPMRRTKREVHYPPVVDVLEPFILLVHQGMIEELFLDDMAERGASVERNCVFRGCEVVEGEEFPVETVYFGPGGAERSVRAKYLVGCDGAHSAVRRSIGVEMKGEGTDVFWGVLDGVIDTDFPDLRSKCAISSHTTGTILCIPRERNMTRLYIELSATGTVSKSAANQDFVMRRAQEILAPYKLSWSSVEWFGIYQIAQRVASSFSHPSGRVFLAGDAAHTHSPKAAQGMNVSMHDTYNLSWKLAAVLQGAAKSELLETYISERKKIATDLIEFDYEHANMFTKNDPVALAANFKANIRFISGVGAVYALNALNVAVPAGGKGKLMPGELLPPARATRFVDSNPVDLQLDIPVLGQFRLYLFAPDLHACRPFVKDVCAHVSSTQSVLFAASERSRGLPERKEVQADEFSQPRRYSTTGNIYTPALITRTPQTEFELADLPEVLRAAKWTVYCDDLAEEVSPLRRKWVEMGEGGCAVAVVRPDGYVGAVSREYAPRDGEIAAVWLEDYFGGFLKV